NFYDGGADRADQDKRVSAVYEQKEFAARVRRQIINTLRLAWVADESLSRQIEFLNQHVVKAKETVVSYREEFFIGQRDLIDLLDAENELNTAQNQYTEAYYDALAARYRIYEGTGSLFEALNLETQLSENDLRVARIQARAVDALPLPTDEDEDKEEDQMDHCDNSQAQASVNNYGCLEAGKVEMGYVHINAAPVVADDQLNLDSGSMIIISQEQLMANDSDPDGDPLKIVDVGRPEHGKLAFNENKNLIYRPAEGYEGLDTFTYTVSDGNGAASTATVNLNVMAVSSIDISKMQFVNFKYDLAELTEISKLKVKDIINQIKQAKDIKIEIYTYTDNIGSDRYNQKLSVKRAKALKQRLIDEGLPEAMITAVGMGEKNPIADNASKAGQAINRRGEFIFKALGIEE
nr:cadherin-like domain-containing protein [Gammaproteobacteria bacterium]